MATKVLAGRYEILNKIGEGGMSVVYKARCRLLNRYVAIKVLKPEYVNDEKFINIFKKESQSAASLSHPNIVNVYDVGREGEINYIVMELIEGQLLSDIIRDNGPLDPVFAVDVAKQIAGALNFAHNNGIIHRDVKPQNIIINDNGIAKITDFGIAKALGSTTTIIDSNSSMIGSVHYFSPEQAAGKNVDERSDIYSLGIVLYEMVSGNVPFDGDNAVAVALMHVKNSVILPTRIKNAIPDEVETIIAQATQKNPDLRYQNAAEIFNDLSTVDFDCISKVSNNRKNEGKKKNLDMKKKKSRFSKKHKIIFGVSGGVLLLLIISLVMLLGSSDDGKAVKVPDLVGLTLEEAEDAVRGKDFIIKEGEPMFSEEYNKDVIAKQTPKSGFKVKSKTEIIVRLSKGSKDATVPDLQGLSKSDAKKLLKDKNLKVGDIIERDSDEPLNRVISQDPEAGSDIQAGKAVDIIVSNGKGTKETVPNIIGLSKDDAIAKLQGAGFIPGNITEEENNTYEKDCVIYQKFGANDKVKKGSAIDFKISKGKKKTSKTISIDFTKASADEFILKVIVYDEDGERVVVDNQRKQKSAVAETITVEGRGEGLVKIYMDGVFIEGVKVNF